MIDVEGHVDRGSDGRLEGWACARGEHDAPLAIEVMDAAGNVVGAGIADGFRGDLAAAGKRGGFCGFSVRVAKATQAGPLTVSASASGDRGRPVELAGSPFAYVAPARDAERDPTRNVALGDAGGARGFIDRIDGDGLFGWVFDPAPFAPPLDLIVRVDGETVAEARAERWRPDLQDVRQGDGRVGFSIPLPRMLLDGEDHVLELCRAGTGARLHSSPIPIRLAARTGAGEDTAVAAAPVPAPDGPIEISIVVNFYDMPREAERTLTSLSRAFQRDVATLAYEVIAVDNGSDPPLDAAFVERFGPEFRLFRPTRAHPSPVFALNEAAKTARGRYLGMMIDGAHLLSPGVLAEASAALRSVPSPVVAVRQWFIGGDQRWLSAAGYSRALEDISFARIGWPDCGYDVFRIGSPAFDSPNHWFDGMSETNCLFLPAERFASLGGFDESFDVAGGGFANLDLFARAGRAEGAQLIALIGEASFHQYHGGTTTNVSDAEKDERVRSYELAFETLRGDAFRHLDTAEIELRGTIRTPAAFTARQWPNSKTQIGLTDAVRPVPLAMQFDEGAQRFARVAYAEAGLHEATLWAGLPTMVAPADLIEIQQTLFDTRPEILLLKDVTPGLLGYVQSILPAIGVETRLLWITAARDGETPAGVTRVVGDMLDPRIAATIEALVGTAERSGAIVALRDDEALVDETERVLNAYAPFVAVHNYLVVVGGVFSQPDLGYSRRWTVRGIRRFIAAHRHFVVDHLKNAHLVTTCPSGFLRRIPNVHIDLSYDPALDDLEGSLNGMNRFWSRFTGPLIEMLRPGRILEIGAEAGLDTRHLLAFCRETGCRLDIIETVPSSELQAVLADYPDVSTLHVGKSLDLIPAIAAPDVVMLDGDHNWRTVYSELTSFRARAQQEGRPMPIVLAHDCAWPYARRDMYYNPDDFAEAHRKPYAYKGIRPGVATLDDDGMNAWYANAIVEGGPKNGVLTGIEDFVAASGDMRLWTLPFFNGLGIIVPEAVLTPALLARIESFYSTASLLETCKALEEDGMNARCLIYEERRKLEQRTDALQRARRLLAERAARIAELEAKLAASGTPVS